MKEKGNLKLFKRRLALLLVFVLTITGTLPAGAAELANVPVSTNETQEASVSEGRQELPAVSSGQETGAIQPDAGVSGDAPEATVSGITASGNTPAEEQAGETVSGNVSENVTVSENISGDSVSAGTISADALSEDSAAGAVSDDDVADVTIMYYLVGSDLERRSVQTTKDMVEIMTGMKWAEDADVEGRAKVNVIAETGGLSFKADKDASEQKKINDYNNERKAQEKIYSASANDKAIYDLIKNADIKWDQNERWEISATSIKKATHDEKTDRNRVMSHHKSTQDAPELKDFIVETAKSYPARNYMLVLWDHGGGPEGGYAGDERADSKENGYITSDQLSKTLSEACAGIREDSVSVNKNFDKFAFLGFDACLMGNLETAMAVTPYAKYLFASEDLESGTGWDHRGYVKELLSAVSSDYAEDKIEATTRKIGSVMGDDMMAWYNDKDRQDTDTISVISLNELQLSDLDKKLGVFAKNLEYFMLTSDAYAFDKTNYPEFLNALQSSIHFNGNTSGIIDLYSLCDRIIRIYGIADYVKTAAQNVQNCLKPNGGFNYNNDGDTNPGPVIYENYTNFYSYAKDGVDQSVKQKLGGLTVFFPHDNFRTLDESGKVDGDSFKNYLDIYYNGKTSQKIDPDNKLGAGYRSLLETFCSIQVVGSAMGDCFNDTDDKVVEKLKNTVAAVKNDYSLSDGSAAYKTVNNMAADDGIVKSRISANDISMKTVVSDGRLKYVYDVSAAKKGMINRIIQQLRFTDAETKKVHRLGYLPDMLPPTFVGETQTYRYEPENNKEKCWFFFGDYLPASIYSVQNLELDEDHNFYDPQSSSAHVMVQIPVAMRKPTATGTDEYDQIAILEVEMNDNELSENVAPRGYYQINIEDKLLYGFVPWTEVSENTIFWALSDLGEYMLSDENDFSESDFRSCYGTAMSKNDIKINRNYAIALNTSCTNVKSKYLLFDVFSGSYELNSLQDGEEVQVSLSLSKDGVEGSIDYIEEGDDGVYPVIKYGTKEYSVSLNNDFSTGYRDAAGTFHPLEKQEDFKVLKPGTYEIVFENYNSETNSITPEEGTTVSVDGVEGDVGTSRYVFIPENAGGYLLTVGNAKSGLTIERKADLPYGIFKTLNPFEDMSNFVSVKNGGGDVTRSAYTYFTVSAAGNTYKLWEDKELAAFKKLNLEPGDKISISADFQVSDDSLHVKEQAGLSIVRQPVKLEGINPYPDFEFAVNDIFWAKNGMVEGYVPDVNILMHYNGNVYEDRTFGDYVGLSRNIAELISQNNVSAVIIDTTGLDGPGVYTDLLMGPKVERKKRPGEWEDRHLDPAFAKYYTIEDPEDVILKKLDLYPGSEVNFRSLKGTDNDEELCPSSYIGCFEDNENYKKDGLWTVSEGVINVKGDRPGQWYVRIGNGKRVPIWIDGRPVLYYDDNTKSDKELVVSENGGWKFYVPKAASSNTVCFYAGYEKELTTITETTKGDSKFNITVDSITPVEYTGKAIVTTTSGKSGSRMIGLTIRDAKGNPLTEGIDYSVSYKNNKNAAGPSDKKAPTLKIRGKGKTYKGLAAEIKYTILPADLYYAEVTVNKKFAPFTKAGKLNAKITLKLPGGVKVPAANYTLFYYDEDDNEVTVNDMKKFYGEPNVVPLEIFAKAKINTKKNAVNNYRAGASSKSVYVTGYPKGSKKMKVKLSSSKQEFKNGDTVEVKELVKKVLKTDSLKVGKTKVSVDDLKEVAAFYDKNLTQPATNDGKIMDRAGTYYLAFELKDEKKSSELPAFTATAVKYVLKGKAIKKGKTKLTSNVLSYNGAGNYVSVNIVIDTEKVPADELYLTYTTRDGSTEGGTVGYKKNVAEGVTYDFLIDDKGNLFIDDIDNGARGSYSITLEGRGGFTGKIKLNYRVK